MRFLTMVMVLLLVACVPRFVRVNKPEQISRYLAEIMAYNQQVVQLKASLDIKASGVMGAYVHEQADVVVLSPNQIHLSVRSFFGTPSMILASNGEYLTVYDFTGQSISPYQKTLVKDDSFFSLMDFDVHLGSLIPLMLAKIPVEDGHNLEINVKDEQLEILADLSNGFKLRSIFDRKDHHVLETRLTHDDMSLVYHATYHGFRDISGIYFPQSFVLMAKGKSRFARFTIEFLTTELNKDLVSPKMFDLPPQ